MLQFLSLYKDAVLEILQLSNLRRRAAIKYQYNNIMIEDFAFYDIFFY